MFRMPPRAVTLLAALMLAGSGPLLVFPLVGWWLMNRSYESHLWLISGPAPFDQFGGGPFQMWMYGTSLLLGLLLFAGGLWLLSSHKGR